MSVDVSSSDTMVVPESAATSGGGAGAASGSGLEGHIIKVSAAAIASAARTAAIMNDRVAAMFCLLCLTVEKA